VELGGGLTGGSGMMDSAFMVLRQTGRKIMEANLSSCGIDESRVAAESIPRIVRGFLAKVA
jgi:uncharacterized spore protein YtfJ